MANFTLDSVTNGVLGGGDSFAFQEVLLDEVGRSIQISWAQPDADRNMELFGYSVRIGKAETEARDNATSGSFGRPHIGPV